MRLVHLEIEIEFAKEISDYSLQQKVYMAITGKKPKEDKQKAEQNVRIRFLRDKLAVRWDTKSFGAILEKAPNVNNFAEIVIPLLDRIHAIAPIGKLSSRNFTTYWLLPAPTYEFPALEQKYRETMIVPTALSRSATDSSIVLDINIKDGMLHHQSGAMGIEQLLDDYLLFKLEDVPKVFLFLWTGIEERKMIQYSSKEVQNYILRSFDHCKSHSDIFERIWREVL